MCVFVQMCITGTDLGFNNLNREYFFMIFMHKINLNKRDTKKSQQVISTY